LFFFFYSSLAHLYLHSFPTRRSSDLVLVRMFLRIPAGKVAHESVTERLRAVVILVGLVNGSEKADPFRLVIKAVGVVHDMAHLRSEEHTSELQSQSNLVCRLLLEKKK